MVHDPRCLAREARGRAPIRVSRERGALHSQFLALHRRNPRLLDWPMRNRSSSARRRACQPIAKGKGESSGLVASAELPTAV